MRLRQTFNVGSLPELRQGRPILGKKLTVPTPGLTCYVVTGLKPEKRVTPCGS